jgi:uncharacterized protein CbrC (UPF0167 family)
MDFTYFENYRHFTTLTDTDVACELCHRQTTCFDSVFYGKEEIEYICPKCLFEKKLYGRDIFTNQGNISTLMLQMRQADGSLSEEAAMAKAKQRTKELEQATPHLVTWQDMLWPCLDGDYTRFIGYGSKPFFESLSGDATGQELFKQSLHTSLKEYYTSEQWEDDVPDEIINNFDESNQYGLLFYVFKSLTTEKIVVWWDSE